MPTRNSYDPDFHPKRLIEMMALGMDDVDIMAEWGISMSTSGLWKNTHPEFREAWNIGYPMWEAAKNKIAEEQALKGNSAYIKYWSQKMAVKAQQAYRSALKGDTVNNTLNVNQMNVLQGKSQTELLETLNSKLQKLKLPTVEAEFKELPNELPNDSE